MRNNEKEKERRGTKGKNNNRRKQGGTRIEGWKEEKEGEGTDPRGEKPRGARMERRKH